jgi:hypothetical protein
MASGDGQVRTEDSKADGHHILLCQAEMRPQSYDYYRFSAFLVLQMHTFYPSTDRLHYEKFVCKVIISSGNSVRYLIVRLRRSDQHRFAGQST